MIRGARRILMINDHVRFGGGGDAVFRLERSCYEDAGFDVFTFSQAAEKPTSCSDRDYVAVEAESHVLQRCGKFLFSPNISKSFRHALDAIRPHFISVHLVSKYPLCIYPQLRGYPVVQTLHGPNLFCTTSWGCLKNGRSCELGVGPKCLLRGCASFLETSLYTLLYMRLLNSVKRNVTLFVCPSEHLRVSAESLGLVPAEHIALGIDDSFKEELPCVQRDSQKVLYVGALAEQKGVHVLLDAFQLVVARVPEAELLIVGRGPMADALRRQVAKNGLNRSVKFLGFVEHDRIVHIYREVSVLAVPSIWKEQFGLVGPEALACGVPCVGSDWGGIREWLKDGEWGFTVPPRDSAALADKIVELLKDRRVREEFGRRGRAWVLEHHSADKYRKVRLDLVERYAGSGADEGRTHT